MDGDGAWLHIRPQHWYHSPAEIVGTEAGLSALADAITAAIRGKAGGADVFASDGEGYSVDVRRSSTISGLGTPFYTSDVIDASARQRFNDLLRMHRLQVRQNPEALAALRWCRANGDPHLSPIPTTDREG